ncbi:helix-turn-helix transcriptional regulator [Allobaculum sp. Allo2]|uniref:helix-turn-helix transcriptional regulator n=1 Tax=Allobaculum sp. Allo2 TaxID=2853432 RepID=UPI001F617487|nr:helix-turn-helix transcriptional regulator [Allobaculum sp. Allo2]UNT92204.1 helix-turn-helix domain-containing protein [Allobaculum sp. Allo2]
MNERIKALRKELGLTQDQLADELAITRQTLYTWESGLRTPPKKCFLPYASDSVFLLAG